MNWIKPADCESAHCLEVCEGGACVEIKQSDAFTDMMVMRSSLRPEDTILVTREEFRVFIQAAKAGQYDSLI